MKLLSSKKAALELSINGIVILIIALAVLGLGLAFVKNTFKSLFEQVGTVSSAIQQDITNKIKESGELLVFDRQEVKANTGKPTDFYIGVKNTESGTRCFKLAFICRAALKENNACPGKAAHPVPGSDQASVVAGYDLGDTDTVGEYTIGTRLPAGDSWFTAFFQNDIKPGDVAVLKVTMQIANAQPDTYQAELYVAKASTCDATDGWIRHQSKEFLIELQG
ncbi:hypothetical protein HY642_06945 [Candidatus Woesearchaeota archaeon]|nr:hypothetical protein [Candidatus Woesearchaeota archaeon]